MRGSLAHTIADYKSVLEHGISGLRASILQKQLKLDLAKPENLEKNQFYEAEIICCDAIVLLASRYAELAKVMALKEEDPKRAEELRRISTACTNVPLNPAGSFYEALQSFWFIHLGLYIEQNGLAISVGRFDQFMYPYLMADLEAGVLTLEEAQEYLDVLWIKFTEIMRAYDLKSARYYGGFAISENLVLGGVNKEGKDATNCLSYMCLDAEFKTRLSQPNVAIRVHRTLPREFLIKACKVCREGGGKPEFFNDDIGIPLLLRTGVSLEDARSYDISGCVEPVPPGTLGITNASMSNLAKALELALNDGKCRLSGEQLGPCTGDPGEFTSIEAVVEAFEQQVEAYVKHMVIAINSIETVHRDYLQVPFTSLTLEGCLNTGMDAACGGARYNYTGPQGVGVADVADSIVAIKQMVFDSHKISMKELIDSLDSNFDSDPKIRSLLSNAAKYGNDDDCVDSFAVRVGEIYCRAVEKYKNPRGGIYRPGLYPVSANVPLGEDVGALPSGREARAPLADGISPEHYQDLNGPTAVLRSAAKLDHILASNGTLLNQKFNPAYLQSEANINRLADMIQGYFDMGGWHIQFNVVNKDTLIAAQKSPEKYPGLLVRVAGYSAFFAELSDVIQDDIIERTEFTEIG
jgi:pyruvate formate-lyase/glycerol dehydratase family glycyl radical enzyme